MKSLQTKIFIFFVLLLLLVQAIAFLTIAMVNKSQEKQEIDNRLNTAKTIFTTQFNSRRDYLAAFAETAAKDYGIKQVFEDDLRSLLVAMNNHRKRIDADIAMAISATGNITAQLILDQNKKVRQGSERNQNFRFLQWLENQEKAHIYVLDGVVYQVSLSPMNVGAKTIGWLVFGFEINQQLAQHFLDITQLHTDFVLKSGDEWMLLASSNEDANLSFSRQIISGQTPVKYIAVGDVVDESEQVSLGFAMYGLRADIVKVLQEQWLQFFILAFITFIASLSAAYIIAASITSPIKRLVKQAKIVASGDYHQTVEITESNELGQLAHEFNEMQSAVLSREKEITHRANHDPLTNLPNRNYLKATLQTLANNKQAFTIFLLNLSRLKDVNETLGHDVGDWLIKSAGTRLASLKEFQLLCHMGADEFVLMAEVNPLETKKSLIDKIHLALEENCEYKGINLQLQMRIGIAAFPEHCSDGKSVLQMADTALHHSKKNSHQVQIYHPELDVNSVERLNLINDLKHAIADNQLELHYQPKLDLASGIVTHVEALVRWKHPSLGMIPPDNFIHIAEQTGQINALTQWVFITTLKQYQLWRDKGLNISVAINISAENLKDSHFYQFICQAVEEFDVPTEKITLEVTESAVVDDPESAIALLQQFKTRGMRISIDDYGTGYSSLAQLKQLPVHELKIDRSFVQRLCDDEDDRIIVRSTIELAHSMGLSVVAEGIEDEFALNWLAKNNCELGQGYFISRPKHANELTPWLLEQEVVAFE
ncbi:putative bifunctional diguanylate cyclase/phosphodiesterase [Cognaticolwellia mytili]|uniref:putative bifunctional diguanylate cyclase/phosphodiesterase n=1 Tax=Cognaticolwellia mytili TaxID=1888913 RepID=UPI000A177E81|nr:EAL domain-containing protein [Cognaticolwellia mytili]